MNTHTKKKPNLRRLGFRSGERLWKLLLTDDLKCLLSVELSLKLLTLLRRAHRPQPEAVIMAVGTGDGGGGRGGPGAAPSLVRLIRALLWVKLGVLQRRS